MNLEGFLPADLRGPSTRITRMAAGLSGAGVYRVEAGNRTFVLKVSAEGEPLGDWRCKVQIQQLASAATLAPPIVHVDEAGRAVLSAFVVDRSFAAAYRNPRTHDDALAELGEVLRRVHALPLPPGAPVLDPRALLARTWTGLTGRLAVPDFVRAAVEQVLGEATPARTRDPVLSHNDVNPTNLVHDGTRLLLLDWDAAGANDPLYDLATVSVFLRMDDETCRKLLAAHDGASAAALPAEFAAQRRQVAALAGTTFLQLAHVGGHAGATGTEQLDTTPSLVDVYQQVRAGTLSPAARDGQWAMGLALIKAASLR